jgi:hypothetical protein
LFHHDRAILRKSFDFAFTRHALRSDGTLLRVVDLVLLCASALAIQGMHNPHEHVIMYMFLFSQLVSYLGLKLSIMIGLPHRS